jgi:hypothetical protein
MNFKSFKYLIATALAAAVMFLISSCQSAPGSSSSSGGAAVDTLADFEVGEAISSPADGLTADVTEQYSALSQNPQMQSLGMLPVNADITRSLVCSVFPVYVGGGYITNFTWDTNSLSYIRSGSNIIFSAGYLTGVINSITITNWFYSSPNCTGNGIELTNSSGNPIPLWMAVDDGLVQSIHHFREANKTVTNTLLGVIKNVTLTGNIYITNIVANASNSNSTAILSGTRTIVASATQGSRTGNWTVTLIFNNMTLSRGIDNSVTPPVYYVSLVGQITAIFNGSWTGPHGSKTVNQTNTINFNGTRIVSFTFDGTSTNLNIASGD